MPSASKMFSEYPLIDINDICERKSISVLNKLPEINGPQLVTSLIKPLMNVIQNNTNKQNEALNDCCLQDDKDVLWIMEVIGYGLSLPLTDKEQFEAVRDCMNIYCEWLLALSPSLSQDKFIPNPIRENPNLYCQKIIGHLYNTFLPTKSYNSDVISRKAVICHRILRLLIDQIASEKDNVINAKTWECLLIFLLGINKRLLKSPTDINDIGTQLADRVISALFQGWLLSCVYFFPSPSFWRTFQSVCIDLRHRPPLIAQWNRVNVCLTRRLVSLMYKHESPVPVENKINFSQYNNTVMLLNEVVLKQCWYRFLHIIGNPVDLCYPKLIYKSDMIPGPDGTLLHNLPFIFHKAIKGLCTLVDIFLAIPTINLSEIEYDIPKASGPVTSSHTPPEKRKPNFPILTKGGSEKSSTSSGSSNRGNVNPISKTNNEQPHFPNIVLPQLPGTFYQNHIKLTSILDVFGKWLFQASFIGVPTKPKELLEKSLYLNSDHLGPSSAHKFDPNQSITDMEFSLDLFEAGQAEALGTLCRIFCLKKDDEDVSLILNKQNHPDFQKLKTYLTSYYLALKCNLPTTNHETFKIITLSSILVNSVHFFEVDLPGSKILVPHFLRAIKLFLVRRDKSDSNSYILIRRACIKILISLLSYPLHYKNLPIKDNLAEKSSPTFISIFPKLFLYLTCGLYNEMDKINVQMILNALLFIMENCVHYQTETIDSGPNFINLYELFNQADFQIFNDNHLEKLGTNMFLLITSFVSDILRRSSLKNSNYSISLTAIEILLALGRIKFKNQQLCNKKCSTCIEQICRFIENQCNKPAPAHSRDMHSTIVAAYHCLAIWIHEHQHLTMDKNCISMLFEIIELGISGSKSNKNENGTQFSSFKSEKILKPTSLRVREAAELLLTTLLNFSEMNFAPGETIIPCHLNEEKIVELLFGIKCSGDMPFNQFRYFIVENSLMISVLNKQICHGETICIIRSAYGKYCWIMKNQPVSSRHLLNNQNEVSFYRSLNKPEVIHRNLTFNYFPDFYDRVNSNTNRYENPIPTVARYINDNPDIKQEYETVLGHIDSAEKRLAEEKVKLTTVLAKKDLSEPVPSRTFEAYRLIISQFENFNFDFKIGSGNNSRLTILNNQKDTFIDQVAKLDMISSKMNDLVLVFYVPKDFAHQDEVFMMNHHQYMTNPTFKDFLGSLGNTIPCETKICSNIFYWNDILHELIFLCPNKLKKRMDDIHLETFVRESNEQIRNLLLEKIPNESSGPNDKIKEFLFGNQGCDIKLFVLWLEKMEDLDRLPFNVFLNNATNSAVSTVSLQSQDSQDSKETETEPYYIIVIHPLKNGLFRVLNYFSSSKYNLPIMDRMLLNKHLLAAHVKLTALSLFRKRRMMIESFQLPHVKRRHKIQELANKFRSPTMTNQKLVLEIFKS